MATNASKEMPDSFPIINYGANNNKTTNNNNSDNDEVFSGKLPTWQHAGILKTIIAGKRNRAGDGDKDRNRHRYERQLDAYDT